MPDAKAKIDRVLPGIKASRGVSLLELMIVVTALGTLLAIAIPAYKNYTTRAKVTEGITLARDGQNAVMEYKAEHGVYPGDNKSAGMESPVKYRAAVVESLTILDNGVIRIRFGHPDLLGHVLDFIPSGGDTVIWHCESSLPAYIRPKDCKAMLVPITDADGGTLAGDASGSGAGGSDSEGGLGDSDTGSGGSGSGLGGRDTGSSGVSSDSGGGEGGSGISGGGSGSTGSGLEVSSDQIEIDALKKELESQQKKLDSERMSLKKSQDKLKKDYESLNKDQTKLAEDRLRQQLDAANQTPQQQASEEARLNAREMDLNDELVGLDTRKQQLNLQEFNLAQRQQILNQRMAELR